MDRVIVNNIPSSNRHDFGHRSINTSKSHNDNQNNMINDVLDLYNKTNEIERVVKENADFIKLENTQLESINKALTDKYDNLVDDLNSILGGQSTRKKMILPQDCYVDEALYGAVINNTTSDITARPSRKVSKLAIFDSITDSIYLPDSLEVDIRSQTINTITETDNDIYAPFYNDNQMYWTRKVVTDNTVDEVVTEYVINLAEEIMTTANMNEITIHPFLCTVSNVYIRYGDSNPWEKVRGIEYHPATNYAKEQSKFENAPRPFTLTFPETKANQIKIVLKSNSFIEGETNLRNFMFGIKHIGAYINYYNTYDSYNFGTEVDFDEVDDVIIEGLTFNFNNDSETSKFNSDIDYEFYYKDEYGAHQKIYEELPFITPTKNLIIKFRIGERFKDVNLRSITVSYKVIRQDYSILVSQMQDMRVDFQEPFNIYFTVKASDSNDLAEIVTCEITLDDGVTWKPMNVIFDGLRYRYEHEAIREVTVKDRCMIRVYDFDGRCGASNKFRISAEIFDSAPELEFIDDIDTRVNEPFKLYYYAADNNKIVKHEFSDSDGKEWTPIVPSIENGSIRSIDFKKYYTDLTYKNIGIKHCYIRVHDGVNEPVTSNKFFINVKAIEPTGIILDKYDMQLNRGTEMKLTHTIVPNNTSDKTVHWSTTDPSVATVNDFGLVTAVNKGKCKIKVETNNKKHYAFCDVTVLVPVSSVTLNAKDIVLYLGEQFDLNETIYPIDADDKRIIWSAINSNVKVDDEGLVTAMKSGSSTVTVTTIDGGYNARCTVEVRVPVSDLQLSKDSLAMQVDQEHQLLAMVKPDNAFNKLVHWSSTNPKMVSVSENGLVKALSPGRVMITATTDHNNISKYCSIEVLTPVSDVILNKTSTKIYLDQTEKLFETIIPENAFNKRVTWSSSNPDVATVDLNGIITPIKVGTTTITVTTQDREKVANCNVTVVSRVTGFNLSPTSMKLLAVGEEKWGKIVNLTLDSFLGASITEREEIIITSSDENIVVPMKITGSEWITDSSKVINFRAVGLNKGQANIEVKLESGRLSKVCSIQVGDPIESFKLEGVESINDVPTILVPAGLSRKVKYTILPTDCIFHLGESEGSVSSSNPEYGRLDLADSGVMGIYHNQVATDTMKDWTSIYTCRGFYNNLGSFAVHWFSDKYNVELDWSEEFPEVTEVGRYENVSIPLKFTFLDELQGNIEDYEFIDDITVANQSENAVKFDIVSFTPKGQFGAILKIASIESSGDDTIKNNVIRIKGRNSANYIEIPLTLIERSK